MKKLIVGFALVLIASMTITDQANASSYTCRNGIISVGDSMSTVKRKCHVKSKETSEDAYTHYWTVSGKFKDDGYLTIKKGKVVSIDQ
jgi:hypothetical protein